MKIRYFLKDNLSPEDIGQTLGVPVLSIKKGLIQSGDSEEAISSAAEIDYSETIPMKEGVEIEIDGTPTTEQLDILDLMMSGYSRKDGKSLSDRLQEIEAKINTLEAKG